MGSVYNFSEAIWSTRVYTLYIMVRYMIGNHYVYNISRKAAFWLERAVLGIKFLCVYILLLPYLLKFDSRKASFWLKRAVLGIKFLCVYILLLPYLLKFDSRKASFWLKRAVLGIKFPMCIHSPSTIPLEI